MRLVSMIGGEQLAKVKSPIIVRDSHGHCLNRGPFVELKTSPGLKMFDG